MERILVVEGSYIRAIVIAKMLEESGYKVDITGDGIFGLEKIKQNAYDLHIISNRLPSMTGEEFYNEVLAIDKDLAQKIIFVTGYVTDFIESTGNPYLVKPFTGEQFIETVKKLVPIS
jgi:two-component system copper resistance phosphate regulon response regulator CusR